MAFFLSFKPRDKEVEKTFLGTCKQYPFRFLCYLTLNRDHTCILPLRTTVLSNEAPPPGVQKKEKLLCSLE